MLQKIPTNTGKHALCTSEYRTNPEYSIIS